MTNSITGSDFCSKKLNKAEKIALKSITRLENEIKFRKLDLTYSDLTEYPIPTCMLSDTIKVWIDFLKLVYLLQVADNQDKTYFSYIDKFTSKQFEMLLSIIYKHLT